MNNTFGNHITLTLFGESHGSAIGAVLDGMPAGIRIDEELMGHMMNLRKPYGVISTGRIEKDLPEIISGVKNGVTEGTPVTLLIRNENVRSVDYESISLKPRPSHADYTAHVRYNGFEDASGGGHFSGRLTAALTAAGAVCMSMLNEKGIQIGTHISELYGIHDRDFDENNLEEEIALINQKVFPVFDEAAEEKMKEAIKEAAASQDSLGGILDTAVTGMEAGIGDPWFDSVESMLAHALFSLGGVKGIEFGSGFDFAKMKGSEANDPFVYENGKVRTLTNHNGGLNGGITNSMPIRFRTAVKPTPSIGIVQKTVDLSSKENTEIRIQGRHDPAIIHRARIVVDAMSAFVLCDFLIGRYGNVWSAGGGK